MERSGTPLGARLAQIALTIVVVGLVVFKVLPSIADWDAVGDSLRAVSFGDVALVIVLALALEVAKAVEQQLLIPTLGLPRAFVALENTAVASNLMPGPSGTAMRFLVYRSWGIHSADFAKGWLVSSAFNNLLVLFLPVVGAILIVTTSDVEPPGILTTIAIAGLVLTTAAVGLGVGILRSERLARRVGAIYGRLLARLRGLMKKPAGPDGAEAVLRFRADALESLRASGLALAVTIAMKFALTALLLWLSIRAVGLPSGYLSATEVFASYTFVRLFTIVDITPGSVGVAEALYGLSLTYFAGNAADASVIVAGVVVFRAATYALPIVLGAICYVVWRTKRSWRATADRVTDG
jgi:putative heme transporter